MILILSIIKRASSEPRNKALIIVVFKISVINKWYHGGYCKTLVKTT